MTLLETFHLEHLPPGYDIHVALYDSVTNASFLHQQLLAGNTDFEYGFIDATVVVSTMHVLAAAYRAVNDLVEQRLKTRNVHSEMVFCLSPNNNIAESFRRFGISPTTTSLIVLKISTPEKPCPAASVQAHLARSVEGRQIPFSDDELAKTADWARVRKIYKLNSSSGGARKAMVNGGGPMAAVDEKGELELQILGAMALRGVQ
ncbi:MAG: hypothetical protein M1818_003624 [Claussenomyces sp. TS43310]|nr:MAG: hypothetical protein M1818_003624 [Claussenomyces sp. TS43310]